MRLKVKITPKTKVNITKRTKTRKVLSAVKKFFNKTKKKNGITTRTSQSSD